jgi:outer membrane protein assembly factor BamB
MNHFSVPGSRLGLVLAWFTSTALLACSTIHAENWPGWRGPRGDGSSIEKDVPVRWNNKDNAMENIEWKVPVPGLGHASPIVWEDRIFVVSCLLEEADRVLCCYDRTNGKMLWQQRVLQSPLEKKHTLNSFASSTPTTDGKTVFVSFLEGKEMVVAAYDFAGKQQWLVRPGVFSSVHGYCSCPILFEDKVIVNGDHDGDAYIAALSKADGQTMWKVPRENRTRSYCTPILREIDGRTQMILSGSKSVVSYDPRTGERHWYMKGPTEQFVASMVYNGDLLFLTCGFPERHIMAIRPDGTGDVTSTHIAWRTTENAAYVPSPVAVGDYFLVVSDNAIGSCFEAKTGRRTWKERLDKHYSASLITAGGLAYFLSDNGLMTVVRPGETFDVVTNNELGEPCFASPAISQGHIYLRAEHHLYSIGANSSKQASNQGK